MTFFTFDAVNLITGFHTAQIISCLHILTHTHTPFSIRSEIFWTRYITHNLFSFSTLWTNQSVSNMSFLNVHWMSYHGMLHFHLLGKTCIALFFSYTHTIYTHMFFIRSLVLKLFFLKRLKMSMGIVGVNSTAGREVKFIDPSKTTKSESSWLGYTLCDYTLYSLPKFTHYTHTHTHCVLRTAWYNCYIHFTMKNEGWGIKEDQIPSSSH